MFDRIMLALITVTAFGYWGGVNLIKMAEAADEAAMAMRGITALAAAFYGARVVWRVWRYSPSGR